MSYFYKTSPDEWDFAQAVKSKLKEKNFKSYQQVFDSIRNDLKLFDNKTAVNWKKTYNNMTQSFLLNMNPTPSGSIFHSSTVNFETVNSSTITNNINNEDARNVTKRKNSDGILEDLNIKKQKHLETSEVPLEENVASSQESQESQISLYTNDSDSTEVDFETMSPNYIVNESNISRMCFDYRNECLKDERNYKNLPDIKKMAINHVYLIDQDTTASSFYISSNFFSQLDLNESYPSLTREDINIITLVNENLNNYCKDKAMEVVLNYLIKDNKNTVAKILYNLLNNYDNAEGVYLKDESLFIGRALDPFVNAVFPTGGTMTKDGHFTYLIGSSELKPDVKFSAKCGFNVFDFLIFEVKCPNSIAKDDLFKMSLELQFMINRMIENDVNNPVVYGVVGKGFDSDVYKMELVAPFAYLMVKIRTFYLPCSTFDFNVISTTIPALLQLQQLSQNQVNKARSSIMSAENEQHRWTRSPLISLKNTL